MRGESIPAMDGSAVYNLEQETHILSAVRKSDGSLIWKRMLPVTNPSFDGYGLAIVENRLVVGDLDLFGIDPATGAIEWIYHPSEGSDPGFARFTTSGNVVYCGSTSGHIFAVDAATGAEVWASHVLPDTTNIYWPIVVNGVIYAGFTHFSRQVPPRGGAIAADATTGAVIWTAYAPVPAPNIGTENTDGVVAFGDKVAFGSSTGIHVVDRTTGTIRSTLDSAFFGDRAPLTPHSPFLVGGVLLLASGSATVTGVDTATLERKWQIGLWSSVSSISGEGEIAYIPSHGKLVAVDVKTGNTRWNFISDESFIAAPGVDDSLVYLPGSNAIYAIRKE